MRERPTALGFTSLLTLLAALHVARPADAASVARQCRRACRGEIAACVDGGGHHRACRKSVLGRCKQDGLTVCQGADGLNNGRRPKGSTTTTTTTTTTTQPGATTTTTRSAVTTTTLAGGGSPATGLHYAPNHNFDSSGSYAPAQAGFNLADLSGLSTLNALPSGGKGLVWLGLCNGADANFINAVKPFIGNPKLFGFYLVDEPDPTGQWNPLCPAANLLAESDWIHANVPGAKTFIALMNFGSTKSPTYANTYNPANSHIDLYGLDPYPCRSELGGCDYNRITVAVAAAEAVGISLRGIVPRDQALGRGNRGDRRGGYYLFPTPSQEQHILATWAGLVPSPVFDYAYSWGTQNSDQALESSTDLQAVFAAHNQ